VDAIVQDVSTTAVVPALEANMVAFWVAYALRHGVQEIPYGSLSDDEWHCIGLYLPGPTGRGRPRLQGFRAILDAVFYVLKSGCPWRLLPKDFLPWKSV
jgi:hypothetical protein